MNNNDELHTRNKPITVSTCYIDKTGKLVIPAKLEFGDSFSEGLARVQVRNQFGYINKTGKLVIPPQFDDADNFSEGLAAVYINGKWGYISR